MTSTRLGWSTFRDGRPTTPDAFNVVKEFSISFRTPIRGIGEVRVHFWLEHLGVPVRCMAIVFCLPTARPSTPTSDVLPSMWWD
jgi:hypothetical protein